MGLLNCGMVWASPDCDWAIQVHKDEPYRIAQRNSQIAQLEQAMTAEKNHLERELVPVLDAWTHATSIYDFKAATAMETLQATNQAVALAQDAVVTDRSLRSIEERLNAQINSAPQLPLGQQLRELNRRNQLPASASEYLIQLANAVELLEATRFDFQSAEKQILQDYLAGRVSLVDGLLENLTQIKERLDSDLRQLSEARLHDEAKSADLAKQILDTQNRIAENLKQMASAKAANEISLNIMRRWDVESLCHTLGRPSLRAL